MSIYVLRYGDLYKIGFSSDLQKRVYAIMHGIPGEVHFVGHMPGGQEVETHLHEVFAASRFSGEWFRATPDLEAFCKIALIPSLPDPPDRQIGTRQRAEEAELKAMRDRIREYAFQRWPRLTHAQRRIALAKELDWLPSRVKALYYGTEKTVVRATETQELDRLIAGTEVSHEQ